MAHYVLSDVHGELGRFHRMLEKIHLRASDTLFILGDVVDRGPEGTQLLREIMQAPNMRMLLGNHEYMMLQYLNPEAMAADIRRWNRNGNAPTLAGYYRLTEAEQQAVLAFLRNLDTELMVTVSDKHYYLVHGFPGESAHDRVWGRPSLDTRNPLPSCRLVLGHTPVLELLQPEERQLPYALELQGRGEHLRILHTPGYIDLDCSCGYDLPAKALACLRLEDLREFYV